MNKQTKKDQQMIADAEKKIKDLMDLIDLIKKNCKHLDYKCQYEETFAWEFDPWRVCIICDKRLGKPTYDEKLALLKDHYDWEDELSEELIKESIDGFNLPRFSMGKVWRPEEENEASK